MTSLSIRFRRAGFTPSALFSNQPEDSRRLRSLTLATLLWSAAALIWVGGLPWVCLAAAGVATIGHWASAGRKLPQRAVAVGTIAAFIVLTILMWQDLVNAITGDRLPAAYYLLMLQSISAFILRTRGGLYGHIGLSGLVLYFVSERSFTSEFAIFLIVFSGLFLTFFAIAHMEDELRTSNIHWSEGQWGRLLLWLGVVAFGLLVASALAFALLPPDYRGGSGAQRTGTLPFLGSNDQTQFNEAQAFLQGQNPVAPGQELQVTEDPAGDGSGPSLPSEFDTEESGNLGDPRDVVMHVRSPVTSYWRGRTLNSFDGTVWQPDPSSIVEPADEDEVGYYWQAYFIEADQPGHIFTGYNPVRMSLPPDIQAGAPLTVGVVYAVLSQQPQASSRRLQRDFARGVGNEYRQIPQSLSSLNTLAAEIVGEASTDFEKLWHIVSFLRSNYEFDPLAPNQLVLTRPVDKFLEEAPLGTSLDFATATVMLARAAGLPSRLAIGYLPGRYDPFSGTHRVRRADLHAWAEIHFERTGWVAFDPAPRPELERFMAGDFSAFSGGVYIFQTRVGGGLYQATLKGATSAFRSVGKALEGKAPYLWSAIGSAAGLIIIAGSVWLLLRRRRMLALDPFHYSTLPGATRHELRRMLTGLERALRPLGAPASSPHRPPSQTLAARLKALAARHEPLREDLDWLARTAWLAAYDPSEPGQEIVEETRRRCSVVKTGILALRTS